MSDVRKEFTFNNYNEYENEILKFTNNKWYKKQKKHNLTFKKWFENFKKADKKIIMDMGIKSIEN